MVDPQRLTQVADYVTRHWSEHRLDECRFMLVLGSVSVGTLGKPVGEPIDYVNLPGMKAPAVAGHAGKLHLIKVNGRMGMVMEGRYHCNEWPLPELDYSAVILPAFLLRYLSGSGRELILTNAAGAVNRKMKVGDLVPLGDILPGNLPYSPLAGGAHTQLGYGDFHAGMGDIFAPKRIELLQKLIKKHTKAKHCPNGVYMFQMGPEYEPVAQVRAIRALGIADLVGMSTVPEAMWAYAVGLIVSGISLVTNVAQKPGQKLDHDHVRQEAEKAMPKLGKVLVKYLEALCA